jgi:dipeptidyl aminopeptidase/acylaminoacyl peptidase
MRKHRLCFALIVSLACGGRAATTPATAPAAPTAEPDVPAGAAAARDSALAAQAAPLVDAFVNTAGILVPDGKRVVFRSNRDGLNQLYVADMGRPDAPAQRLVTAPERVGPFSVTHDGRYVIYALDKGADENWSFWRVDLDGSNPTELTPGETLNRDYPFSPAHVPDRIFYSARKKETPATTLFSLAVAGGEQPKSIYRSEQPGYLVDVRADGKVLIFIRTPTINENYLDVVDVATGKVRTLYPRGGKAIIDDAKITPDGRRVFVATDAGKEQGVLLALDTETGEELARYADPASPTASVVGCEAPVDRSRLACQVSAGNHSLIRLIDTRTFASAGDIKLPLGTGFPSGFSGDGQSLVVTWSTPSAPTDLLLVDARTAEVTPLRREPRPSISNLPLLEVRTSEVAGHDGLKIPVHAFLPPSVKNGSKLPVIVNYHGGPSSVSEIRWNPQVRYFTSLGYAWVEPNVRGSSGFGRNYVMADDGAKRREALKDIETTGKWVAAQPWADKNRIVIYGGSYGGYTTLVGVTRYPQVWRAGVDIFGVANWVTFMQTTSGYIREVFKVEIGDPSRDRALLEELSPIRDVAKIRSPLFVYAGANDPRVPRSESDLIVNALRTRGVPVEYMVAEDEGHSLARRKTQIEFLSRCARFLEQALQRRPAV